MYMNTLQDMLMIWPSHQNPCGNTGKLNYTTPIEIEGLGTHILPSGCRLLSWQGKETMYGCQNYIDWLV